MKSNEISNYNLCPDISDLIDLTSSAALNQKRKIMNRGYVYACDVRKFLDAANLKNYIRLKVHEYNLMGKKAAHGG